MKLRSGQEVRGTYLGGNARQLKMEVNDQIQTFDVGDVESLRFSGPAASAAPMTPAPRAREGNVMRPDDPQPTAPPSAGIEIPAGSNLAVRMIDAVDSRTNHIGQTFNASMDEPLMLNGDTVIPRGADVVVKLVDDKESGKLAGKTILTLDLVSVRVNGRMVDINTETYSQASGSRGARTAKMAGGGAALGAIIGAIAGGGKGAAIGAGAGAGVGAGAEVLTKGQQVRIPSETRLTFMINTPVRI